MHPTHWIAALVLLAVASATFWAFRRSPGMGFAEEFGSTWKIPWGRQLMLDFYGLEIVLALFMLSHAAGHGDWLVLGVCLALMPLLGASAAAAYWLLAVTP